ncbi:hypothetical protein Tco_0552128 [Tanacetum coccineum]
MANEEVVVGANVAIPLAAVEDVSKRFIKYIVMRYVRGKRLAGSVFATREGMERVLECGPWLICLVPIILNVWTPNTWLKKDTITNAPICVKIHEVPIVAYSEGRASYARILIEVSSLVELKDSLVVAIPFPDGSGHSLEKVEVEYEWQPPRCGTCLIFDHKDDKCPKRVTEAVGSKEVPAHEADEEGFIQVTRKNGKGKQNGKARQIAGIKLSKPKPNIIYRVVKDLNIGEGTSNDKPETSTKSTNASNPVQNKVNSNWVEQVDLLSIRNSFETLMDNDKVLDENLDMDVSTPFNTDPLNDDEEEVEEFYAEPDPRTLKTKVNDKGASTPVDMDDNVMLENNLCLCAILESHVANSNLQSLCSKVFKQWSWTSNGLACTKGSRIILGWNPDIVKVSVITFDDQVLHTCVYFKDDKKELFCSFVYAHNNYIKRRSLWQNLSVHNAYISDRPWCVLGDFNVSLSADEKSKGTSYIDAGMRDFQECVNDIEMSDINSSGLKYTWTQKPEGMMPYRILDHSPDVLKVPMSSNRKHQPFKFYNVLTHHSRFREIVATGWNVSTITALDYKSSSVTAELDEAQKALDLDPNNLELREDAVACLLAFNDAFVKGQASRNRIDCVTTSEGVCLDGDQVPLIFIDHYTSFLGQPGITTDLDTNGLFSNKLSDEEALHMIRDISNQEVRDTMFSIGDNKAPGPDGYSSAFFKESWEIVRTDITKAVKEVFINSALLKELNHTTIALIPKCNMNAPELTGSDEIHCSSRNQVYGCGFLLQRYGTVIDQEMLEENWFISCGFRKGIPRMHHTFGYVNRKLE